MLRKIPNGPFDIIDRVHGLQGKAAKLWGRPTSAMRTSHQVGEMPVIFIHSPQTGGTSLGHALGVKRRSHAAPYERLSERSWLSHFSVVAVRDPFTRFTSSYWGTMDPSQPTNGLVKKYGPTVKQLSPFEFLELLEQEPAFGGSQLRYTCFPSKEKPFADLILRFESIKTWSAELIAKGVVPDGFEIPYLNAKAKKPKGAESILGIDGAEMNDLKRKLSRFFAEDYEALGYRPPI